MFVKIPFESAIEFKTNIKEITKMSLEHDYNINDNVVLGNFYVSGKYIAHEVSINDIPFNYTLPFSVDVNDNIKKDTMEFNIEDFSYEIINDNTLKINIEYSLSAEVEEDLFKKVSDEELASDLVFVDDILNDEREEKVEVLEEKELIKEDEKEKKEEVLEEERNNILEEEKTVMDTIKDSDDTFVTYHIHIVKNDETIETICNLYNVPSNIINEYNDTENIITGDKLIIPTIDE